MNLSIKRCCNEDSKYVFFYGNERVIVVCEDDSEKLEYRTGVKKVFDFVTKKELKIKEVFSDGQ